MGLWPRHGCRTGSWFSIWDATVLTAHSEKQDTTRIWRTFGCHPLLGDSQSRHRWSRGPVAELLRPGNAGSNTAADHVAAHDAALGPLPVGLRASTSRQGSGAGAHRRCRGPPRLCRPPA